MEENQWAGELPLQSYHKHLNWILAVLKIMPGDKFVSKKGSCPLSFL